jgi:hypothetical protein
LEKWKEVGVGFAYQPIIIGGVNVWDYKWLPVSETEILRLPHPSHLNELHDYRVYDIEIDYNDFKGVKFRFAASELSNGVWGFYIPHW